MLTAVCWFRIGSDVIPCRGVFTIDTSSNTRLVCCPSLSADGRQSRPVSVDTVTLPVVLSKKTRHLMTTPLAVVSTSCLSGSGPLPCFGGLFCVCLCPLPRIVCFASMSDMRVRLELPVLYKFTGSGQAD